MSQIRPLLTNEQAIAELEEETRGISMGSLNWREKMEFFVFSLLYKAFLFIGRKSTVGGYLRIGAPHIERLRKKALRLNGRPSKSGLSAEQMLEYSQKGLIGPFQIPGKLQRIRDYCLRNPGQVYSHLQNEDIFDLAMSPSIVGPLSSILGDSIDCVRSSIFVKEGGENSDPTKWHMAMSSNFGAEDNPDSHDFVSVWVALTDVGADDGCLKMLPGSFRSYPAHLVDKIVERQLYFDRPFDAFFAIKMLQSFRVEGLSKVKGSEFQKYLANRTSAANVVQRSLSYNDYLAESIREHCTGAVSLLANAGQFYIFTSENFHASMPNFSPRTRVAIAFRYARGSLNMNRAKNLKTLIDMVPEHLRTRLRDGQGYFLPTVRVYDEAKGGVGDGDSPYQGKIYLNKSQLFGDTHKLGLGELR